MPTTPDLTAAQEQFLESVRQGQDAVIEAVRVWSDATFKAVSATPLPDVPADPPKPAELVAGGFDFAERLLAEQRAFAERLLAAAAPAPVQEA